MFYKLEIKDHIRVAPMLFGLNTDEAVLKSVKLKYTGVIDEELGRDDFEQVLDDEREELDVEKDYNTDKEAQADDFGSAKEGNDHSRALQKELLDLYNRSLKVEAQVVQDLASENLTKKKIYEAVEEYEELQEEMWRMFGVE